MELEERVIGSIESLEAQLEMAREFVRLRKWTSLSSIVWSITRAAECLAESASKSATNLQRSERRSKASASP